MGSGNDAEPRAELGSQMELLEITLTCLQRRNRAAFVKRSSVAGGRVLESGEKVVLRDEDGEYFAGTVIDEIGAGPDGEYLVNVGVRLPEEYAMKRLSGGTFVPQQRDPMQDLLDMLGEAKAMMSDRPMPAQRGSL